MTRPESVPQAIWDTLTPEAQACFAAVIGRLEQRIADLEARPNQNSTNSSRPPSTDPPGLKRKVEPAFWTLVKAAGVEPTNTTAERAPRHAVIWRRVGGGTDSRAGSRFVERMLTAVATCRQHGRDILDYLTSCFEARLAGRDIPSLPPN